VRSTVTLSAFSRVRMMKVPEIGFSRLYPELTVRAICVNPELKQIADDQRLKELGEPGDFMETLIQRPDDTLPQS
jgi:hypothetical protein